MNFKATRGNFSLYMAGETHTTGTMVTVCIPKDVFQSAQEAPLDWRLNEVNHSPTGFEWGYQGSGPAQLAWCLLRECGLTVPQVRAIYFKFKDEVIATAPQEFEMTSDQIMEWVSNQ